MCLDQTPEMLPVLKQAGVVDSGGQGLVQVLKGAYGCHYSARRLTIQSRRASNRSRLQQRFRLRQRSGD